MPRLKDKVCVITGATGGIGSAAARLFVREGARVVLVDREEDALRRLAEELGAVATYVRGDVARFEDNQRCVAVALEWFGGLDVFFANAGVEGTVAPLELLSPEAFEHVLNVNVRGSFLGIKAAIPALRKRGGGSIMITSSIAGLVGSQGLSAYVTSKHAVIGLMRAAAVELAPSRIRVNTLNPGPIDNRMMRGIEGQVSPGHERDVQRGFESQVPLGRYGTNDEIAQLALFLASDESSYCTGSVFVADGGFVAH